MAREVNEVTAWPVHGWPWTLRDALSVGFRRAEISNSDRPSSRCSPNGSITKHSISNSANEFTWCVLSGGMEPGHAPDFHGGASPSPLRVEGRLKPTAARVLQKGRAQRADASHCGF